MTESPTHLAPSPSGVSGVGISLPGQQARLHTVREAALEEEGSEDEQPDHKIIHHLTELVRRAMREPRQVKMQGEQHTSCHQRAVTCWHCGKKGHVRRECPTRENPVTQSASLPGNGAVAEVMGQSSTTNTEAPKVMFKTGSIHNAVWILAGSINSKACDITIDTGSYISIVSTDLLTEEDQICVQPVSSCLRTVTGKRAPIHEKGELQLKIGSLTYGIPCG